MEPTPQQIQELRTKFLQKLEQQTPESGGVHPADLAKIKNGDAWLRRFLQHNDCDMKETLDMLWESVDWRNRVGANANLVSITPNDFLNFVNNGSSLTGTITLTNTSDGSISYKIKTTTPDKFRVRPSTGALSAGSTVTITIILQHGYQIPTYSRDRFMVMCLPIESSSMDPQELSDLWKQCNGKNVEQHPLRCNLGAGSWTLDSPARVGSALMASSSTDIDRQLANIAKSVNELKEAQDKFRGELKWTTWLQWLSIIFIMVLASLAYIWDKNFIQEDVCYPHHHHHGESFADMV